MFIVNKLDRCDYFPESPDNFAVMLKGASLDKLSKYFDGFHDCFIVSDYDDELSVVGPYLKGKNVCHFTNRSRQASLSRRNYRKYNIQHIQTGQVFRLQHLRLLETYFYYKMLLAGLKVHSLPEKLLKYHKGFGEKYFTKFPNTGILSLTYTLEMIRPKTLWVFGLDFYSTPYMVDQSQGTSLSLEQQAEKMGRLNLPNYVCQLFGCFPETEIKMASYYADWPDIPNMTLID